MHTELLSLSKAFSENLYRIPDYQRGYSWGEKQLKDFWNDLEQLEPGRSHYTGVLTLEEVSSEVYGRWDDDLWVIESKRYKPYYVVDGQQRLTTSIMLIQVILEAVEDGVKLNYDTKDDIRKKFIRMRKDEGLSSSYIFGYEKDNPSYEYLKTKILCDESERHALDEETIYTINLGRAKELFQEKISGWSHSQLELLYTKVTQYLLFNVFTITEDIDVFVTFETMNNRGKPLSHLELLKNRLIYLSTKLGHQSGGDDSHDAVKLRKTINECWKTAYHYLGKGDERRLNDDEFLRVQFILYFNVEIPGADRVGDGSYDFYEYTRRGRFKEFLLDDVFNARRLMSDVGGRGLLTLESINVYSLDIKAKVRRLYEISNPKAGIAIGAERLWLERISRINSGEATALLLAVYSVKIAKKLRLKALEHIERLLFFKGLYGYYFNDLDLDAFAVGLVGKKTSLDEIVETIQEACDSFVGSKEFKDAVARLGKRGYYGWNRVRYFMFEYEQELLGASKTKRERLYWDDFGGEEFASDYTTVEHIYPQKAAHPEWQIHYSSYSIKQRNALKNSIGNLLPLSKPKNSSLGNRPFSEKKGNREKKVGYMYGCYSEIEVAAEAEWTPFEIVERGIRLLGFLERRWGCVTSSDIDKVKALGLDFVARKQGASKSRSP